MADASCLTFNSWRSPYHLTKVRFVGHIGIRSSSEESLDVLINPLVVSCMTKPLHNQAGTMAALEGEGSVSLSYINSSTHDR